MARKFYIGKCVADFNGETCTISYKRYTDKCVAIKNTLEIARDLSLEIGVVKFHIVQYKKDKKLLSLESSHIETCMQSGIFVDGNLLKKRRCM